MKSTVKLYKDCLILEDRNFIVDDIADYLATLTDTLTLIDFQYIKHDLSISIKINKNQSYLDFTGANDYNYCSIQNMNTDGLSPQKTIYYFIDKMNWTSENTIRLDLIMDTINTFRITTDFTISSRTTILREHRDRWKKIAGATSTKTYTESTYCRTEFAGDFIAYLVFNTGGSAATVTSVTTNANSYSTNVVGGVITVTLTHDNPHDRIDVTLVATIVMPAVYQRIIDPVSEGITSILYNKGSEDITDNNNLRWYLIYKNKDNIDPSEVNPINPIEVQLRASETIVAKQYNSVNIQVGDLGNNDYILITAYFNNLPVAPWYKANTNLFALTINGFLSSTLKNKIYVSEYLDEDAKTARSVVLYKDSNKLYMGRVDFVNPGSGYLNASQIVGAVEVDSVYISGNGLLSSSLDYYEGTFTNLSDMLAYKSTANQSASLSLTGGNVINGISMLDRTDSKLIKVIECPYCPSTIEISNQYYIIGAGWDIVASGTEELIVLSDINIDLINEINSDITSPLTELYQKKFTPSTSTARTDYYESKIYHSDYYQKKIVYDSFNYLIALENIDYTNSIFSKTIPDLFKITWVTANTINSRFLAEFPQLVYSKALQDFEAILYINRNNELPIFNSTYLNYLRTGFNYDVKQKDAYIEKANDDLWATILGGAAQVGAGAAVGFAMGNVPGAIAGAITGGISATISTVNQYRNAAYNIARQEDSIAQKLAQAKAQATSVSAADDVNLLMRYCPVAKCLTYQIGDNFKKAIADLFYYCGYRREVQGSPNFTNRYWFNFVSAELVIDTTNNIPSDIMNDIIYRYKEGITQLHHHTTWNFSQDKENWEVSLL